MGNCVGHSGSDSKDTKRENTGVTTLKKDATINQESEQEKQNILKDPKRIEEPISKNCKNLIASDNQNSKINNENGDTQTQDVKICTNTTSSPKSLDTEPSLINENAIEPVGMFGKTSGEISTQNEKERSKCSGEENEVKTRRDRMDSKIEKIGERRSSSMESTNRKKYLSDTSNSVASNHTNDNMGRKSLTSSKSFIDSDENEGSFEKMVLSACFSENVRKAFVLSSEEFLNSQKDRKCTKRENNKDAIKQHKDVIENETTVVDSPSTQCFPDKTGFFAHETNLVDPDGNVGVARQTNAKELEIVQDLPEEGLSLDKDSCFPGWYSDCEKTGCHKPNTGFIDLEDILVSSSRTTENEFDMKNDIGCDKGEPLNEDSNFSACFTSDIERMDMIHVNATNEEVFESYDLNQESESVDESLYEICEGTALNDTLSYCKINKERSCECFERVDIDCCCKSFECIEKHA